MDSCRRPSAQPDGVSPPSMTVVAALGYEDTHDVIVMSSVDGRRRRMNVVSRSTGRNLKVQRGRAYLHGSDGTRHWIRVQDLLPDGAIDGVRCSVPHRSRRAGLPVTFDGHTESWSTDDGRSLRADCLSTDTKATVLAARPCTPRTTCKASGTLAVIKACMLTSLCAAAAGLAAHALARQSESHAQAWQDAWARLRALVAATTGVSPWLQALSRVLTEQAPPLVLQVVSSLHAAGAELTARVMRIAAAASGDANANATS